MTVRPPFGPLLRSLRQSARLTIEDLSHASGVSVRAIGDMERGVSQGPQRRTVQALADALGIDDEQRAELADAAKAGRPRTTAGPAAERSASPGLPRGLSDFVGRTAELELLAERARSASANGPTPVVVVHGAAGLGKTACAVRAAELLHERFPGGRLYVDLRGVDPEPMTTTEALRRLLLAVGLDARAIAEDEDERAGQLRAVLADRSCLVVLDNAADEAQVRPLLPARGAGMVIVTSRRTLAGLEGVTRVPLAPFSPEESAELLAALSDRAADESAAETAAETARVSDLCGRLPLALRIAGTRLASRPGWTMRHLAERLSDEDRRLANLVVGDVGVEAAFALSYVALPEPAKECFRRLALVPAVDFGVPITAVLIEADLYDAEDQLDELVELGLLQHEGADRYRFHDLIRLYANQRLDEDESAAARAATQRRMVDWLLATATSAGQWFERDDDAPPPGHGSLVPLTTPDKAKSWLQAEKDTWLAGLRLAASAGNDELVAGLGESMRWFAVSNPLWLDTWHDVFGLTWAAAARLSDPRRELWHRNRHVWAFLATHVSRTDAEWQAGAERAMEVYRLAEDLGAVREQADALCNAAEHWRHLHDDEQALRAFSRGRELAEAAGDERTVYWAGGGAALALDRLGRLDEAVAAYQGVLGYIAARPVSSAVARHSRVVALEGLAVALRHARRWQEAVQAAETGLSEAIEQDSAWTVNLYWSLGSAYAGLGVPAQARPHMTQAIAQAETQGAWAPSTFDRARAILAALDSEDDE
ncbi:ATP-binding protein [Promicromonospora sp. NPDC060204]|uniref:ATP-binding protein n=1 Tax=Promicromonospora sp. NPDC060204 TaxID=3347071 RepID=UPI0036498885